MDGKRYLGAVVFALAAAAGAAGWMMVATLQPEAGGDAGALPLETVATLLPPSPEHAFAAGSLDSVDGAPVDGGEDTAAVCRSVAAC